MPDSQRQTTDPIVRPTGGWDNMKPMGFYLWLDTEVAWAQGTYEYRPMGAAVIASSDLFRRRDFDPRRKPSPTRTAVYAGQFASLGHLNAHLKQARRQVTENRPAVAH